MGKWKEVARLDTMSKLRTREAVTVKGEHYMVVEVFEKSEEDITSQCTVELVRSRHSDGYYCSVVHSGKSILALGVDKASKRVLTPHYSLVRAEGASISFRILKEE